MNNTKKKKKAVFFLIFFFVLSALVYAVPIGIYVSIDDEIYNDSNPEWLKKFVLMKANECLEGYKSIVPTNIPSTADLNLVLTVTKKNGYIRINSFPQGVSQSYNIFPDSKSGRANEFYSLVSRIIYGFISDLSRKDDVIGNHDLGKKSMIRPYNDEISFEAIRLYMLSLEKSGKEKEDLLLKSLNIEPDFLDAVLELIEYHMCISPVQESVVKNLDRAAEIVESVNIRNGYLFFKYYLLRLKYASAIRDHAMHRSCSNSLEVYFERMETENSFIYIDYLVTVGLSRIYNREFDEANTYLQKSLSMYKELKNYWGESHPVYPYITKALIKMSIRLNDISKASDYLIETETYYRSSDMLNTAGFAELKRLYGVFENIQDNFSKALEYNLDSLKIFEILEQKQSVYHMEALGTTANCYWWNKDFKSAEEYYQKERQMLTELGYANLIEGFTNYKNLALVYINVGEYDKAEFNIKKSVDAYKQKYVTDTVFYYNLLVNLGYIEYELGKYSDSVRTLTEAVEGLEKLECTDRIGYPYGLLYLGKGLMQSGETASGFQCLERSKAVMEKNDMTISTQYADLLFTMGIIFIGQNQFDEAITALKGSMKIADTLNLTSTLLYINGLTEVGDSWASVGNNEEARKYYVLALKSATYMENTEPIIDSLNERLKR